MQALLAFTSFSPKPAVWKLSCRVYSALGYYGGLTVMHRIDCTEDVIFVPSFPSSSGLGYSRTDVLGFFGRNEAHAKGSNSIVREVGKFGSGGTSGSCLRRHAGAPAPAMPGERRLCGSQSVDCRITANSGPGVYILALGERSEPDQSSGN